MTNNAYRMYALHNTAWHIYVKPNKLIVVCKTYFNLYNLVIYCRHPYNYRSSLKI